MTSTPNIQLMMKVKHAIEANPDGFDMDAWINTVDDDTGYAVMPTADHIDQDGPKCGTTLCLAGWTLVLSGKPEHRRVLLTECSSYIVPAALEALGLDDECQTFEPLFYETRWPLGMRNTQDSVAAAGRLLTVLAGGGDPWDGQS